MATTPTADRQRVRLASGVTGTLPFGGPVGPTALLTGRRDDLGQDEIELPGGELRFVAWDGYEPIR